jgi:hypothetical protein
MKNITFSADESLIERARLRALHEKKTLNVAFREWLARYAGVATSPTEYRLLLRRLGHVRAGRKFSREEMNARGPRG